MFESRPGICQAWQDKVSGFVNVSLTMFKVQYIDVYSVLIYNVSFCVRYCQPWTFFFVAQVYQAASYVLYTVDIYTDLYHLL